jgi:hypothetical protein
MGSNGYMMVDGIRVHKVAPASQNKPSNVWIYNTVCTGYTWSPLTCTIQAIARRPVSAGSVQVASAGRAMLRTRPTAPSITIHISMSTVCVQYESTVQHESAVQYEYSTCTIHHSPYHRRKGRYYSGGTLLRHDR